VRKKIRWNDYTAVMASIKANDARLKTALDLKRTEFEGEFGKSPLRAVLFALHELRREVDIDEGISQLRDLAPGYMSRREDLMALASAIDSKPGSESAGRSAGGSHSTQPDQERAAGLIHGAKTF
jgi:hypothetical protein